MKQKATPKIFCIGLNKTGTVSLHVAFKILGFKSIHNKYRKKFIGSIMSDNLKNKKRILSGIEHYDAYSDWSFPSTMYLYKVFDKQYPNSKFILNTRNLEDWVSSREKHVKRTTPNLKKIQKKYPKNSWFNLDKEKWKKEWKDLHRDVFSYFKNRPQDLLVINVPAGEGWEKLCPFLGVPIPDAPFPKKNTAFEDDLVRFFISFLGVNGFNRLLCALSKIKRIIVRNNH